MWSTAREVAAGDTVIIWLKRDQVQPLVITPGKDFNTKFGNFRQADFVGVPYGSKVPSRTGKGFIHILRPTPELWTIALPHRTQILYLADIAFITSYLNIRPGSRVIEAGTGSASFSHSIARNIGSAGHLWSYEFHEARYLKAQEEFARHGMADTVTLQHRNVCKDGFTNVDEVDSVFLDLPAPWEAVEHAKRALRKDCVTRICCFSPCMEQVLRTVNALNEAGFTDITMYEALLRPIEVFQMPTLPSVDILAGKLKESEVKREEKRLRQIAANKAQAAAAANKRKRDEAAEGAVEEAPDAQGSSSKRVKTDGAAEPIEVDPSPIKEEDLHVEEDDEMEMDVAADEAAPTVDVLPIDSEKDAAPSNTPLARRNLRFNSMPGTKMNVSKALPEIRGHTSYLTFACLIPVPRSASNSQAAVARQEPEKEETDAETAAAHV